MKAFFVENSEHNAFWVRADNHLQAAYAGFGTGDTTMEEAFGPLEGEGKAFYIYDKEGETVDCIFVRTRAELDAFEERCERQRQQHDGRLVYSG